MHLLCLERYMRNARRYLVVLEITEVLAKHIDEWQIGRHPFDVIGAAGEDAPTIGRGPTRDLG